VSYTGIVYKVVQEQDTDGFANVVQWHDWWMVMVVGTWALLG